MSDTEQTRRMKLEHTMRQRLQLEWIHAEDCPERGWAAREFGCRPERCHCGMPPILALEIAREAALEELYKGLRRGDWKPPGGVPR